MIYTKLTQGKLEVTVTDFCELSDTEKEIYPYYEDATFLRVKYKDQTILLEHDNIAPEDKTFKRDLSWPAFAAMG